MNRLAPGLRRSVDDLAFDFCGNNQPNHKAASTTAICTFRKQSRARAVAKEKLIKVVKEAAITDWRAAAWILERSYREEYGKSWADEHPAQRTELNISADEHARRLREIFGVKRAEVVDGEVKQLPNGSNTDSVQT